MVTWTADLLNTQINMVHDDTRKLVTEEELFGDHNWFGQVSERPLIETIIPWKGIKETNQC